MISVMILGYDHPACDLLRSVIDEEAGITCKHAYPSSDHLLADLPHVRPDVILISTGIPDNSSNMCITKIRQLGVDRPILILAAHEDDDVLYMALRAGATGYLLKGFAASELITAIRDAQELKAMMSPGIARLMIQATDIDAERLLSKQEFRILQAVSHGDAMKEIATRLAISRNAIAMSIYEIYRKLSLDGNTHQLQDSRRGIGHVHAAPQTQLRLHEKLNHQ